MPTSLRQNIYEKALEAPLLDSDNVFWGKAPQGIEKDYLVINLTDNPVNRDTFDQYEELIFQLSVFGKELDSVESIQDQLVSIFDYCPFTDANTGLPLNIDGWEVLSCHRLDEETLWQEDQYWQVNLVYRAEFGLGEGANILSNTTFWLSSPPYIYPDDWLAVDSGQGHYSELIPGGPGINFAWVLTELSPVSVDGYTGIRQNDVLFRNGARYRFTIEYVPMDNQIRNYLVFTDPANADYEEIDIPVEPRNQDVITYNTDFRAGPTWNFFELRNTYEAPPPPFGVAGNIFFSINLRTF